jgi:hypothetical protein
MGLRKLLVGFDKSAEVDEAMESALEEWQEFLYREKLTASGEPTLRVIDDDLERDAMGEYAVEVSGEVDGDQ